MQNFNEKKNEKKKVTSFPYSAGVKKSWREGEKNRDLEGYRMSYIFSQSFFPASLRNEIMEGIGGEEKRKKTGEKIANTF